VKPRGPPWVQGRKLDGERWGTIGGKSRVYSEEKPGEYWETLGQPGENTGGNSGQTEGRHTREDMGALGDRSGIDGSHT